MRITDCNGVRYKAYPSLEEAIENYDFSEEELNNEKYISLGVGLDGKNFNHFVIGEMNRFTTCFYRDLENWEDWYDDDWIEVESWE